MNQQYSTFQSLFKSTDEYFGLNQPLSVPQQDTSAFDKIAEEENEGGKSSRVTFETPEIDHLRTVVRRIKAERQRESTVIGQYLEKKKKTKEEESKILAELSRKAMLNVHDNWQDEVNEIMERDSSDCSGSEDEYKSKKRNTNTTKSEIDNKVNLFQPKMRLPDVVSSFDVFESDYVDLETLTHSDPLDVLFPNVEKDDVVYDLADDDDNDDEEESPRKLGGGAANVSQTSASNGIDASTAANTAANAAPVAKNVLASLTLGPSGKVTKASKKAAEAAAAEAAAVFDDDPFHLKSEKEKREKLAKAQRIKGVDIGFNAAASIEQNALMGKRPRDYMPSHKTRVRSLIAALNHSTIATTHKNTKPDLMALELKYFHRPRMIREKDRPWQISCKNVPHKKASSSGGGVGGNTPVGAQSPHRNASSTVAGGRVAYTEADKQNLSLAHNRVNFILLEYIEEFPPVMLNYGMASAIFNYYRTPKGNDEDEERRTKARLETDKLYDSVLSASNRCRLPRHVMLLLQLRGSSKPQYDYDINIPRVSLGETKVVGAEDESPFLGQLDEGEIQQAFVNNLFKAPIFRHAPHATDFLLIRTKLQQKVMNYSIRTIPYIYLCGQMEPQKIVPRPIAKISYIQEKFYMLAAARYLQANFDGADFADIQRSILKYTLRDKVAPHKAQHRLKLKDVLKKVGDEVKDPFSGELKWYAKEYDEDEGARHHNNNDDQKYSAEEIARSFSPEDVCLQESCNAAEYRLYTQNITDIDLGKVESWLTLMHKVKQGKLDRAQRIKRLINDCVKAAAHGGPMREHLRLLEHLYKILVNDIQRLEAKLSIGRYVFDRLVIAPWNTTEAYVKSHLERDGQGKMELLGIGDPSGCGEGFAFVRILKNVSANGTVIKKPTVKLVSTDKDLRKLTKKDAVVLLVGFGLKESDALKLRRWDRIHMIREMSTRAEMAGTAKNLHKYARGDGVNNKVGTNVTGVGALESFAEKCQHIWNRQKAALTKTNVPSSAADKSSAKAVTDGKKNGSAAEDGDDDKEVSESEEEESDSDEDFTMDIERTLNARAVASAAMEANEAAKVEKAKKDEEAEKKEFSSIKSFMDTLGGTGTKPNQSVGLSVATTNNNSSSSGGGQQAGNTITPRRKLQVGISSGEEAGGSGPMSQATAAASMSAEESALAAAMSNWTRPRKVVKRTIKSINAEGVETIRVEYLFGNKEVDRVEYSNMMQKKERDRKRSGQSAEGVVDDELDEAQVGSTMASMSLNLGKMKKVVDQNNLVSKKDKNKHSISGYADLADDANLYTTKAAKSTKRSSLSIPQSYRLPRVALAARLEKELIDLNNMKFYSDFWFPVSEQVAPGYFDKVTSPISLSEIRSRIADYRYETAAAMVADMQLMASNASLYNGPKSVLALAASKLVDKLKASLNHEAVHFGPDKDSIRLMEEAIKKKNSQFHRLGGAAHSSSFMSSVLGSGGHKPASTTASVSHGMLPPSTTKGQSSTAGVTSFQRLVAKSTSSSGASSGGLIASNSLLTMSSNDLVAAAKEQSTAATSADDGEDVMDGDGLWM